MGHLDSPLTSTPKLLSRHKRVDKAVEDSWSKLIAYCRIKGKTHTMDGIDIKKVPAPWKCTADIYAAYFFSSPKSKAAAEIDTIAYSPLEKESSFASPEAGRFAGGIGSFMLVRYTDTPVGTYDELAIIPGSYTYQVQDKNGKWVEKKNPRLTRIYVSQKDTMYNGRFSEAILFPLHSTMSDC